MIATRIREALQTEAAQAQMVDVRVGLGYTAVVSDSATAGVAYTPREDLSPGCSVLHAGGALAGRPATDLLSLLESPRPLERAIGLATANALVAARKSNADLRGDILRALALNPGDRVGMVGCFEPLIAPLQAQVASLTIFERSGGWTAMVKPAESARDLLPTCSVALITSTTLITESLETLLDAAAGCREVALLGPSTPLLPEVFAHTPVTCLSGIRIERPAEVLRVVSEGGGTREFAPYVQKVNLRLPRTSGDDILHSWGGFPDHTGRTVREAGARDSLGQPATEGKDTL
ncbi:MAG: Rossmann-like domain-containing protein [Candidatus Methylomirabilales bacterium]